MEANCTLNDHEVKQHKEVISSLCDEFPQKAEYIGKEYWKVLFELIPQAKFRTYLSIIVTRKIRSQCLQKT